MSKLARLWLWRSTDKILLNFSSCSPRSGSQVFAKAKRSL